MSDEDTPIVEQYSTPNGRVHVVEQEDDRLTVIVDGRPGTLYVMRTVEGSLSAGYLFERGGFWYVNVALFLAAGQSCSEVQRIGPFSTETEALGEYGIHTAYMAEHANPEAFRPAEPER